jgi:cell wall-associated NlpC family hydrolase
MTHPLVTAARARVGTPFRHLGRSGSAVDCVGFGALVYLDCGVQLPVPRHYGRKPFRGDLMRLLIEALGEPFSRSPLAELQPGDVCTFRFRTEPHHVALIADAPYGGLSMIHADSTPTNRCVVEHRLDDWWRERLTAAFRRPV